MVGTTAMDPMALVEKATGLTAQEKVAILRALGADGDEDTVTERMAEPAVAVPPGYRLLPAAPRRLFVNKDVLAYNRRERRVEYGPIICLEWRGSGDYDPADASWRSYKDVRLTGPARLVYSTACQVKPMVIPRGCVGSETTEVWIETDEPILVRD